MSEVWQNRALALAGMLQAVDVMDKLAKTGYLETREFETAVTSLFAQNPTSTEAVFGELGRLRRGLSLLEDLLSSRKDQNLRVLIGYCLGVLHLQQRLSKTSKMLKEVGDRLQKTQHQVAHFGLTHDNVIAAIAETYTQTISTFSYRVQVSGEYQYLQQARVANQVRVLLLAAIRAAILWRQVGGSRLHWLFGRRHLLNAVRTLMARARSASDAS